MSRRSSRKGKGLLLDTSFLLPILGFETSGKVMRAFHKLSSYKLYYSDLSLLEALWKIVKVNRGTKEELARIEEGVRAIRETMNYAPIDEGAVKIAAHMYRLGHRDLIDDLLYAIALSSNLRLLTVDEELARFVRKHGLSVDAIMTPEAL